MNDPNGVAWSTWRRLASGNVETRLVLLDGRRYTAMVAADEFAVYGAARVAEIMAMVQPPPRQVY